jgi:hypothetical protein
MSNSKWSLRPNGGKKIDVLLNNKTLIDKTLDKCFDRYQKFCDKYNINKDDNDIKKYVNNNYISIQPMHNENNVMRYCASRKSIPYNIITCGKLSDYHTEYGDEFGFWYIIEKDNDNFLFYRKFEKFTLNRDYLPWNSEDVKKKFDDEQFEMLEPKQNSYLISNESDSESEMYNLYDTDDYENSLYYRSGFFEHDRYSSCSSRNSVISSDDEDSNSDY